MASKKKAKKDAWMDDHDDAHFSDNPAYAKTPKKKSPRKKVSSPDVMTYTMYQEKTKAKHKARSTKKYAVKK